VGGRVSRASSPRRRCSPKWSPGASHGSLRNQASLIPPAKREILRAAVKLFSQRGLDGTSIRDIAEESGYTNPALYKHFAGKEELALYLFETCHRRLWTKCHTAIVAAKTFEAKLGGYIGQVLELVDEDPEAMAFLSDSARALWPKAGPTVRQKTMIGLLDRS
jgi:TetR/AcrR family transcriptional regulator, repressor of fatR-cypB operon